MQPRSNQDRTPLLWLATLVAVLAMMPIVVFLVATIGRLLQPVSHEPAGTEQRVYEWFVALPATSLTVLLFVLPAVAVILAATVVWQVWQRDPDLRADTSAAVVLLLRFLRRPLVWLSGGVLAVRDPRRRGHRGPRHRGLGALMASLAVKLQLPAGSSIRVVNLPAGLRPDVALVTSERDARDGLLVFVPTGASLPAVTATLQAACQTGRLTWIAYPKAGQLGTDLNRDRLAASLVAFGLQPVRQIALDEARSALRLKTG